MTTGITWINAAEPEIETIGVSYMLAGDCAVSNIDPAAMVPTEDNEWVHDGPHIMIVTPDQASSMHCQLILIATSHMLCGATRLMRTL